MKDGSGTRSTVVSFWKKVKAWGQGPPVSGGCNACAKLIGT